MFLYGDKHLKINHTERDLCGKVYANNDANINKHIICLQNNIYISDFCKACNVS